MRIFSFSFVVAGTLWGVLSMAADAPKLLPFQGKLTDASGNVLADGARTVQFKIYDAPVGGQAVWNGEVQKLTVNSGFVNTILGSKASLSSVDFNRDLYLELTVDANNDGQIAAADPPLLPRQSILPAVFAKEAAETRLLDGYNWSALFGTNNPANGTLLDSKIRDSSIGATKIRPGSISALHIAPATVTSNQIADGTIGSKQLTLGAVTASAIADGAIGSQQIAMGAVSSSQIAHRGVMHSNLAQREVGIVVGEGGCALSTDSGNQDLAGAMTTVYDVTNLTVTITTTGRPVFVGLIATASNSLSQASSVGTRASRNNVNAYARFTRGAVVISRQQFKLSVDGNFSAPVEELLLPPSTLHSIDIVGPGTYTYKFQVEMGQTPVSIRSCSLIAFEL